MGNIEILSIVITAVLGALPPLTKSILEILYKTYPHLFGSKPAKEILKITGVRTQPTVSGTRNLLAELRKAAADMDRIMDEITRYTEDRQASVTKLENDLRALSQREQELKTTVDNLQNIPLPAVEYFAKFVEKTEKRSAKRDYVLFLLGVVLAAVVALILKHFELG